MKVLKAVNNYVTIEPVQITSTGLSKLNQGELSGRWGRVKSVGPGVPDMEGTLIPCDISEGALVYTMAHGRHQLDLSAFGSPDTFMCSILDVLCYMEDEDNMKIKPLGNYVVVDKIEPAKETAGGILLPQTKITPPNLGVVTELGVGWTTIGGNRVPFQVQVGDKIAYEPFRTMIVDLVDLGRDEKFYLVQHGNIMGIVEEE